MHEISEKQTVNLTGEINSQRIDEARKEITRIHKENRGEWITLYIYSEGGSVSAAFGLYDYIRGILKPKLQTVALGAINSMAVVLFLMGEYRVIGENTHLFLHQLGRWYPARRRITRTDLERVLNELKNDEKRYVNIICRHAKLTPLLAHDLIEREASLSIDQIIEMGFAHEVVGDASARKYIKLQ